MQQKYARIGRELAPPDQRTPEPVFHKAEADKWWPIIREANIKPE